jgi:hypothetical protein
MICLALESAEAGLQRDIRRSSIAAVSFVSQSITSCTQPSLPSVRVSSAASRTISTPVPAFAWNIA